MKIYPNKLCNKYFLIFSQGQHIPPLLHKHQARKTRRLETPGDVERDADCPRRRSRGIRRSQIGSIQLLRSSRLRQQTQDSEDGRHRRGGLSPRHHRGVRSDCGVARKQTLKLKLGRNARQALCCTPKIFAMHFRNAQYKLLCFCCQP